jgi:hypothetical protein
MVFRLVLELRSARARVVKNSGMKNVETMRRRSQKMFPQGFASNE